MAGSGCARCGGLGLAADAAAGQRSASLHGLCLDEGVAHHGGGFEAADGFPEGLLAAVFEPGAELAGGVFGVEVEGGAADEDGAVDEEAVFAGVFGFGGDAAEGVDGLAEEFGIEAEEDVGIAPDVIAAFDDVGIAADGGFGGAEAEVGDEAVVAVDGVGHGAVVVVEVVSWDGGGGGVGGAGVCMGGGGGEGVVELGAEAADVADVLTGDGDDFGLGEALEEPGEFEAEAFAEGEVS